MTTTRVSVILGLAVSLAVVIGAPAVADDVTGRPVVVKSEFIYEKAPFPSCHASTIEETPSGLVASWFGGTDEGEPDVGIWVSRLEDGKWTAPIEVANGIRRGTRYPCWNPVLFQVPDGPLLLFYKVGPNPRLWWGMLTRSDDGGKTWSKPAPLPATLLGPVKNKPILLDDDDTVLCGSSTEHEGWRLHFESFNLSDQGAVCKVVEPDVNPEFGVIQPTILKYADGRLQVLCRSRQNKIVETWSSDGGKTWSEQKATSLPNPNSGIDGVTLDDGTQVLVYNHTTRATGKPRQIARRRIERWKELETRRHARRRRPPRRVFVPRRDSDVRRKGPHDVHVESKEDQARGVGSEGIWGEEVRRQQAVGRSGVEWALLGGAPRLIHAEKRKLGCDPSHRSRVR